MLETLGLSPNADAVYRVMLAHREWGVRAIAADLGLSEKDVRDALDTLAENRLVRFGETGAAAVPPASGLAELLAQAEQEMITRRQQIDATRAALVALTAQSLIGPGHEAIIRIEGVDAVRARIEQLAASARGECVSFNPNVSQTPDAKRASRPVNEDMLARGVQIRCIYQDSFRNHPDLMGYASWLGALGGRTRTVPVVPMMMVLFDNDTALVPLDPADSSRGACEVTNRGMVLAIKALFEQVWSTGTPLGEAPPSTAADLDPTQVRLLQLLAQGCTDETAARLLGISVSTVRRIMAGLMDRLAARSRFQAGLLVAENGWLAEPAR